MKAVRLHDGQVLRFPSNMSDAEIQGAVKSLIKKIADAIPQEEKQDIIVNVPEFPELPQPVDYSKLFKQLIAALPKEGKDFSAEIKEVTKAVNILGSKIDAQTKALTDAITMQSDVLAELVVAYREPKKIMRDSQGRLEGIE